MEIDYQLNASDLDATRLHLRERARAQKKAGVGRLISLALVIATALEYFLNHPGFAGISRYERWAWVLAGLAFGGAALWARAWVRSDRYARWLEQFAGSYALTLTPAGIAVRAPGARVGFHAWPEIVALESAGSYLYFYLRRDVAFAVPRAAAHGDAAHAIAAKARELWAEHPAHAGKSLPETPAVSGSLASQAWANIRAAARMVFFLNFDVHAFRVSHGALLWLLLAHLFWLGAVDYVLALPAPEFSRPGIGAFGESVLLTLAWAVGVSSYLVQRATVLRLLVMITASMLVIDMVYLPAYQAVEQLLPDAYALSWGVYIAATLWLLAAVFRIMRQLYRQPAPAALFMTCAYALLTLALAALSPPEPLYYSAEPDDGTANSAERKLDVEDVYYRQQALVRRALDGLAPRNPGETGLYFVGFAGDASEREFGNEVRYAWDLLNRRFNTAGHSLALINDAETVGETPLANAHNLEAVLQGVARRMDREKDVLFLFLSSHGAQDRRLAVSFSPLQMDDLRAEKLKAMLDKSGIRNRVIVVSACYSGGFLDVLKDDNTLVLTASRRDHVAYGCGDITEYTYFGEAYFVKALQHHDSFIAAFDEARRLIAEREKKEGEEASGPQIHVGRNIGRVLEKLKVLPASAEAQGCPENCSGESG